MLDSMDVHTTYHQNGQLVARLISINSTIKLLTLVNGAWLHLKLHHLAVCPNYATKRHLMMEYVMISITMKDVALMVEIAVTISQDGTPDARKTMG